LTNRNVSSCARKDLKIGCYQRADNEKILTERKDTIDTMEVRSAGK
jgi:hypothetical protein